MQGASGGSSRSSTPRRGRWSQGEVERLRELWGLRDDAAIARELNRPVASVRKRAEQLFPAQERTGPWTASELMELKRYLGKSNEERIARILGRPLGEVQERIRELGKSLITTRWTREEVAQFKRMYGTRTDEDLARIFERSVDSVKRQAAKFALAKDKAFLRNLKGESATRMPRWSEDELRVLRELYATHANLEIARRLERSVKSVVSKAHNLGLKKDPGRLREMGRENVSLRYRG